MRFPIDVGQLQFVVVTKARERYQFEDGVPREQQAPKTDKNGNQLYHQQVCVLGDENGEVIRVSIPRDPGLRTGQFVMFDGFGVTSWSMNGRDGLSFSADSVRVVRPKDIPPEEKAA